MHVTVEITSMVPFGKRHDDMGAWLSVDSVSPRMYAAIRAAAGAKALRVMFDMARAQEGGLTDRDWFSLNCGRMVNGTIMLEAPEAPVSYLGCVSVYETDGHGRMIYAPHPGPMENTDDPIA